MEYNVTRIITLKLGMSVKKNLKTNFLIPQNTLRLHYKDT